MATELARLITRGAEAEIYLVDFFGLKAVLKKRVSKAYRNPVFNELFIKNRTRVEARILSELRASGLNVPAIYFVDDEHGILIMEYINGSNLVGVIESLDIDLVRKLALDIGVLAAKMHSLGIYHGDFTIANMMHTDRGVVLIDFGLSGYSMDIEEYAIDLHLLKRSIYVAKPSIVDIFMDTVLTKYRENFVGDADEVIKRMQEISTRGRYVDKELRKRVMRERYIE